MQDEGVKGLQLLLLALLPGFITAYSTQPSVKLCAAIATCVILSQASEHFQTTAREARAQLKVSPRIYPIS
jgi:hypothetical protein